MSEGKHTPWAVIQSPTDSEMFAVHGAYLVADHLPIEDARLIAAAHDLLDALKRLLRFVNAHTASGEVIPAQTVEHVRSLTAIARAEGRS